MALLTHIGVIPLFSTIEEAVHWGGLRGIVGYHTHHFNNKIGYMGGEDHSQAMQGYVSPTTTPTPIPTPVPTPTPIPTPVPTPTTTPTTPPPPTGGTTSGGGY